MSSSGQGYSTDNDNQIPTNSPDATGSSASAVTPSCPEFLEFALRNVLTYSTPADAYKRCRENQAEEGLHGWKQSQCTVSTERQSKYGEFKYSTESDELGATIVRRFSEWDEDIPRTMTSSFRASGSDVVIAYCKWESAPQRFFFMSKNGGLTFPGCEAERLTLVMDREPFTVDFRKDGQPEKPPQLVYDLKSRMEENMKRESMKRRSTSN